MAHAAYARYQEIEVTTIPAPRRVVLLYDHLLRNIQMAGRHIAEGMIEARCARILKAEEIVVELLTTLNHEVGGDLSQNLAALYAYWLAELTAVNLHPDAERLAHVARLVAELRTAWAQAADEVLAPAAPAVA